MDVTTPKTIKINTRKPQKFHDIEVINSDSVSCLLSEGRKYKKACVLNMASYKHAGGGVERGTKSQEEDLCRCSNLFSTLPQEEYPLSEDEILYSSDVLFFKDSNYQFITDVVYCDVVSAPAINLNRSYSTSLPNVEVKKYVEVIADPPENYAEIMKNKITAMFDLSIKNGCDCIILGAWGCGVYKNKPEHVAQFFKEVISENNYQKMIKIFFAIIDDRNSRGENFATFQNILK
jgi:uncharacterized protein (TIGR02452 family)